MGEDGGRRVGLLTYLVRDDACEIVTIDAFEPGRGIGTALLDAVKSLGHRRLWLVTTNDNIRAQRFYERSGFRLVAIREDEIERSRRLKPQIPLHGRVNPPFAGPRPRVRWRFEDAGSTVSGRRA